MGSNFTLRSGAQRAISEKQAAAIGFQLVDNEHLAKELLRSRPGLVPAATQHHPDAVPAKLPHPRFLKLSLVAPLSSLPRSQHAPLRPTRPHLSPSRPRNHPCPPVKSVVQNPHPKTLTQRIPSPTPHQHPLVPKGQPIPAWGIAPGKPNNIIPRPVGTPHTPSSRHPNGERTFQSVP